MRLFLSIILFQIVFPLYPEPDFPNFAIFDFEGNRSVFHQILKENPNKIFILNFTSVDCIPCKKEIPDLILLEKKNPNMRLFCIFSESANLAKPVGKELGLSIGYSDPMENIQKIFGVKSYPTTVVIHKGKILSTLVGYNEENTKQLRKLLEK